MKLIFWASALAGLLQPATAFYPYRFQNSSEPLDRRSVQSSNHARRSMRVPIRKVAVKRDNAFRIVYANSPSQATSTGLNQDGTDLSYMISVQFGSSKKLMNMLLDTAAVNTWVMNSNCTSAMCSIHNTFGPADSTTLKETTTPFAVAYGTGSVSGLDGSDQVTLLSHTFPLTFGLANNVSKDFANFPMDGICGMGRLNDVTSNPTGVGAPTLMDALATAGVVSAKQFGIRLSRNSDGLNNGEVNFGGPDESAYQGSLNYITTVNNTNGFWEIPLQSAGVDGKAAPIQSKVTALIDSGTSYILIPLSDAVALHASIPQSNQTDGETFTVPCSTTLPITLMFGGSPYNISPKDWVGASVGNGQCHSNIIGLQTFGPSQWLVGDVFLKNVYTLFDYDGSRIGFGYLQGSAVPNTTIPTNGTQTAAPGSATAKPTGTTSPTGKPSMISAARRTMSDSWFAMMVTVPALCLLL